MESFRLDLVKDVLISKSIGSCFCPISELRCVMLDVLRVAAVQYMQS
jgi:hypothetical protein